MLTGSCDLSSRRWSEGLVLTPAVVKLVVMVWVVEVVGLVPVVAVTDDGVLDAFALQILLLVNAVQLCHQLCDEALKRRRSTSAQEPP